MEKNVFERMTLDRSGKVAENSQQTDLVLRPGHLMQKQNKTCLKPVQGLLKPVKTCLKYV
jgi:hypothetical protein